MPPLDLRANDPPLYQMPKFEKEMEYFVESFTTNRMEYVEQQEEIPLWCCAKICSCVNDKSAMMSKLAVDTCGSMKNTYLMHKKAFVYQEAHLKVLRQLEINPTIKQRELSTAAGVSLGKTNYCVNALLEKGLIKVNNFKSNKRKLDYVYLLTPAGIAQKVVLTQLFLKRKIEEYEALKAEITLLKLEASDEVIATIPRQSTHEKTIHSATPNPTLASHKSTTS